MRNIIAAIAFIVAASAAWAQVPPLTGRINDVAGVLSNADKSALEHKLEAVEQMEGHPQVAVILPATMGGLDIERFANDVFHAWKLGQSGKDNGVLIVIAPKERKWRIEVGYGLEGAIPDGRAKTILSQDMDPHLKGGKTDFYGALDAAITTITADIAKEKTKSPPESNGEGTVIGIIVGMAGIAFFLVILIGGFFSSRRQLREEERQAEVQRRQRAAQLAMEDAARARSDYYSQPVQRRTYPSRSFATGAGVGAAAASTPKRKTSSDDYSSPTSSWGSSSSGSSDSSSSSSWGSSDSGSSFGGGGGDSGGGGASSGD